MKKCFETENGREDLRLMLMGKGGLSLAARVMGISNTKLSRLLNGWIAPSEKDLPIRECFSAFQGHFLVFHQNLAPQSSLGST